MHANYYLFSKATGDFGEKSSKTHLLPRGQTHNLKTEASASKGKETRMALYGVEHAKQGSCFIEILSL